MYLCTRCNIEFKDELSFTKHLNATTPCDFYCNKCGEKMSNRRSYFRHIEKAVCKPVIHSRNEIDKKIEQQSAALVPTVINNNNNNSTINGDNNTINNNNINNHYNIIIQPQKLEGKLNGAFVKRFGITPHDSEFRDLDFQSPKMMWLEDSLTNYIKQHSEHNVNTLTSLVLCLASHMYCNPDIPENVNIMDNDPTSNHNKVYSGTEFIEDHMTKDMRNRKIMQKILYILTEYVRWEYIRIIVKNFITDVLIPYILKFYFTDIYGKFFQNAWQSNTELYGRITKEIVPIPEYQCCEKLNFDFQKIEYEKNRQIICQLLEQNVL